MARPVTLSREALAALLRSAGVVSATDLAARLKVDRTTIVRALGEFGSEVVSMGATRSTHYALRRPIGSIGSSWPIYRIDPSGRALLWAEIFSAFVFAVFRVVFSGRVLVAQSGVFLAGHQEQIAQAVDAAFHTDFV